MEIEVKGHSGCDISVAREQDSLYVYKSTYDVKYISRLLKQADKQQKAADLEYQHIRVPKIFDVMSDERHATIKMQYVYSKNFVEYFEQSGFEQIDYLIHAIEYFVEKELLQSPVRRVPKEIFIEKFEDVRSKTLIKPEMAEDVQVKELMQCAAVVFESMDDWQIPVGWCHGDLTFSNILFNGNNYYLIDFLDSYVETPLQDIVKIRQDTAYRWSQLMYMQSCDSVRLRIIFDKIDREVDAYFSERYEWYRRYYKPMQLMNLLRILPYATEHRVIDYLKTIISQLLNEI
jgi:tRNA A-37 threonylcarbamoyl transferase component Bud32